MSGLIAVFRREFSAYFSTPLAAVFLVIFLFLAGLFTFSIGALYDRGQADLRPFFSATPWLYLFLVPAVSMRLWAEERRLGTIELLTTLPLRLREVVLGKFLAAWAFTGIALILTAPIWLTVEYLGSPDRGAIVAGYFGSFLMAGAFLAVGSAVSAATKSQVIAFVACSVACFLLMLAGFPIVLDFLRGWAPYGLVDAIAGMSFMTRFEAMARGVIDLRDALYFVTVMIGFLLITAAVVDARKAA